MINNNVSKLIIQSAVEGLNLSLEDLYRISRQINRGTGGREVSLAITKTQEGIAWLHQAVTEIDTANNSVSPDEGSTDNG